MYSVLQNGVDIDSHHDESDNVHTGVEAEYSLRLHNFEHTRKCKRQDRCLDFGVPNQYGSYHAVRKSSLRTQKLFVATAHDIPTSRWESGNTSAEYVKGTGPIPGE